MANADSLVIPGVVTSGLGKGAHFVSLDWVQARLSELMGARPYAGTLNLRVPSDLRDELFSLRRQFDPVAAPGEAKCAGYLVALSLRLQSGRTIKAWAVMPELTAHPDTIELVSPHFLREHLALRDGDRLHLVVSLS